MALICKYGGVCDGCMSCQSGEPVGYCDHCGDPIYAGDDIYDVDGIMICDDCIWHYKRRAS